MQSELIAACSASDNAVWFHAMMAEFPFLFGIVGEVPAVPLLIDNQACLSVANHPENSTRTRHIALREFRIRDYVELKQVRPLWCPGTHNLADHFTKLLQRETFQRLNQAFGMGGMNRKVNLPVLLESASKPDVSEGHAAEFVKVGLNGVRKWEVFLAFDHPHARAFYDAFVASSGIVPNECGG